MRRSCVYGVVVLILEQSVGRDTLAMEEVSMTLIYAHFRKVGYGESIMWMVSE